jgi:hypothetical protein
MGTSPLIYSQVNTILNEAIRPICRKTQHFLYKFDTLIWHYHYFDYKGLVVSLFQIRDQHG